ncbi:MAG: HepT-like ribonuclease domain-containing protein, partial [Pseudomonadota bacterium]
MSEAQIDIQGRDWRLYIDDMISFAEKVLLYTEGLDRSTFEASGLNYDATVRNLELIGEAATRIPA